MKTRSSYSRVQRAVAVREVSRRKGYLLDPADDNVLSFLTLPQLRELMVQHWPCFEPYVDERPVDTDTSPVADDPSQVTVPADQR